MNSPPRTQSDRQLDDVFVARQPIYDRRLNVCGYEVLYRNGSENKAVIDDPGRATAQLLLNAFVEIGLDALVGPQRAFVNVTREFLIGRYPLPLEGERLVLEILEDILIDDELVAGVAALAEQGYNLALDDVTWREELKPLLEIATIVKVDLPKIPPDELTGHFERLRAFPVQLLAEKVETYEEFERCRSIGFELFQGYFLARPQLVPGRQRPANQASVLHLLSRLGDPLIAVEELEHLVGADPTLTYKLLRYINSSKFSLRHRIESLRQVVVLLGIQQVRTLAMLVFLSGTFQKPNEILSNAMVRALLCEQLGRLLHHRDPHTFFTAGLLSGLDAILDMPLPEVIDSLQLAEDLRNAVLRHIGPIGQAVQTAIAHEQGDWPRMEFSGLEPARVRDAYLSAIGEARAMWSELLI